VIRFLSPKLVTWLRRQAALGLEITNDAQLLKLQAEARIGESLEQPGAVKKDGRPVKKPFPGGTVSDTPTHSEIGISRFTAMPQPLGFLATFCPGGVENTLSDSVFYTPEEPVREWRGRPKTPTLGFSPPPPGRKNIHDPADWGIVQHFDVRRFVTLWRPRAGSRP
jgi:hypothetical protein